LESGLPSIPTDAAAGDLLLTDAFIRLAFHLRFGKVNPNALNADWDFQREIRSQDPAQALAEALASGSLARELEALPVVHSAYDRMKAALAKYRALQDAGGWPRIGDGPTLHKGDRDPRVATLRTRLEATGDLPAGGAPGSMGVGGEDPTLFDDALEAAVRTFQYRHGLDVDGVVGSGTLEALNVPVEARVDQIRVNLERARWILQDLGEDFAAANIAAFEVHIVRDDTIAWTTRAQVGKTYRKTPLFRADLTYVVFNPTWTVPPTILAQDVLPAIQSDLGYLETKHMDVLTHDGRVVDPATVDWASYSGRDFPYIIRQRPGPWNALGQVKFIFPNPNFVFIHDTPSTSLFDRSVRTFSSGCVRIEDPLDFAVQVLGSSGQWDDQTVADAVASQETQTVHLAHPLPVLLLYWTAEGGRDGLIHFREDVYDRDGVILQELDGPFDFWLDLARKGSP
jgi:murein L,D-transpeptidase YcbB/YkuD